MQRRINPYIAGSAVLDEKQFFGRQDIIEKVTNELHNKGTNALVLYGQRRIGKTSLLRQLENKLPNHTFLPIYFDLQDLAHQSLKKVLVNLMNSTAGKMGLESVSPDITFDGSEYFRQVFMPQVYREMDDRQRLVYLFDEFDVLDQVDHTEYTEKDASNTLFPFLRNEMSQDPRSAFVFAIGRRAEELSMDFKITFKSSLELEVGMLDRPSAEALVRLAEKDETLVFSDSAVEGVLKITNCHPYFTQLLCQRIWEQAYDKNPPTPPKVKTSDVDLAFKNALEIGENALTWIWDGLNPAQKIYAAAFAEAVGDNARTISEDQVMSVLSTHARRLRTYEVEDAPKYLVKQGVLEQTSDREYHFSTEFFFRWVQQKKPLREVKDELDRLNPLANRMFEVGYQLFQKSEWEESARFFKDALKEDPNHVQARIHLGEVYIELSKTEEAVSELRRAYELDQDRARWAYSRALIDLAEFKKRNGDEESALDACEQALKIHPIDKSAQAIRSHIWLQRAIMALEQGNSHNVWENLTRAGITHWEEAVTLIREGIQDHPSWYRTRLFIVEKLLEFGKPDEAQFELDAVLTAVYNEAGIEQEKEVVGYFRKILEKSPHQAFIRQRLGEVLLKLGHIDESIAELESVYKQSPDTVRESLAESLLSQIQLARQQGNWVKVSEACKRLSQIKAINLSYLPVMAEIISELQESLATIEGKRYSKPEINKFLLGAQQRIRLLGVTPLDINWRDLATNLSKKLTPASSFSLSILCESDNALFSRSLISDMESSKSRQSFQDLKFIRDQALQDLPELLIEENIDPQKINVEITHLPIPITVIQIDERIFTNLWLTELDEYFDEIVSEHPWYNYIVNYLDYYFDPATGKKFASSGDEELLELFDHRRISRGIYPRNSFYDTDYAQLVVWAFIFDRQGRLLIHRRADNAKDNQGMWDKSVGGHTDLDDFDTSRAIPREVIEELYSEEIKQRKSDFTAFRDSDEEIIYLGEWRPEQRKWHPFNEIKMFKREWAYFRLKDDERLYSPRVLPNGTQKRLRVIADVFLFVAGPQLNDDSLGKLKNSIFKLIELTELKVAMDKSIRGEKVTGFGNETQPKFSPDLVNAMTGKLRNILDEFSQHIKNYMV